MAPLQEAPVRFFVPATLWLLTAGTSIGSAQAPPPTGPALPPVFESLQDGQWVRVTLAAQSRLADPIHRARAHPGSGRRP